MAEIVNLRQARKAKARAAKVSVAETNRGAARPHGVGAPRRYGGEAARGGGA